MIPKLVAHRGYMECYPENSLLGLEMALKAGACMVELDVQMNAGREFIVLHDSDFVRTASLDKSIFDLKSPDLLSISVNEPERFGDQFFKTPVPTLEKVMELVARYPLTTVFVEIKDESLDRWGLEDVMHALQDALMPYASQCVIIAFNMDAIKYVKQQGPYSSGWVLERFDEAHKKNAEKVKPEYLICNHKKVGADNELWQGDWSWMLYDITDPELALQWGERGAALIETRDIGAMLQHGELQKESCHRDS